MRIKYARHTPARRDPLHSIQNQFSAGFTRIVWSKVRTVDEDVSLLRFASCGVSTALPQAIKRRNHVHMIKAKFGQRLRSRTLTAQINEALCKVLCHNLCVVIQSVHELGIETNFEAERSVSA